MDVFPLCHKVVYKPQTVVEGQVFHPTPITACYTACSVNATPNLGRFGASLEAVPPQSTAGRTACCVKGV